jgi:ariadne-1
MADLMSSDDECDTLEGIEQDDDEAAWVSASPLTVKVITKASLLAAQREDLHKVMEMLGLKEQHARTLLIHHRWDVERLLAVLVDKGKDCLFSQAGVTLLEAMDSHPTSLPSVVTCHICIEDKMREEVTMMDCGHHYCNDCWTEYFIVKINEGQSKRIRCMAHKCNAICDEDIVRKLVSTKDPEAAERFERFLLESYIDDNNKVKWCPSVPTVEMPYVLKEMYTVRLSALVENNFASIVWL